MDQDELIGDDCVIYILDGQILIGGKDIYWLIGSNYNAVNNDLWHSINRS